MGVTVSRRTFVSAGIAAGLVRTLGNADGGLRGMDGEDLARAGAVDEWLHHPIIGDPSWDAFVREPGNPIYRGSDPHLWPVNGTLFRDPRTGMWYAFVSVYPRGYFGPTRFDIRILRERAPHAWEDLGLVFGKQGPPYAGGGPGGGTDASVVYHDGRYHMLFGWADRENRRGGLGYAWSNRPEGPYHCAVEPVDDDYGRKPLLGRYVRSYASTLVRRRHDWLILHMMSTPGNAGGTWGLFARTARDVAGPYCDPVPLLLPQSDTFHPPLAEFFPAYVDGGRVYAPATSVAANRNYQALFSAPIEEAEKPDEWRIERLGSLWHQEPEPWEATGIWGQTFAAAPDGHGGLRVLFPCKTADDTGTISVARRARGRVLRDGFVLSGPNGPAFAVLRRSYTTFHLEAEVEARGAWHLAWGCNGPLGSDHHLADSRPHAAMRCDRVEWRFDRSEWSLVAVDARGEPTVLARGLLEDHQPGRIARLSVRVDDGAMTLWLDGREVARSERAGRDGRLELFAERGAHLRVRSFRVAGVRAPYMETWLPTEALAGAAAPPGEWEPAALEQAIYSPVPVSGTAGARAKFNFEGSRCELMAPVGPAFGVARVIVDGTRRSDVSFRRDTAVACEMVFAAKLRPGRHALVVEVLSGRVPCGWLRVAR